MAVKERAVMNISALRSPGSGNTYVTGEWSSRTAGSWQSFLTVCISCRIKHHIPTNFH